MDLSTFWMGSTSVANIQNSLRFRSAQRLVRVGGENVPGGSFTVSFWAKLTRPERGALFSFGNNFGPNANGATFDYGGFGEDDPGAMVIYPQDASNGEAITGRYRDYSGWYHFMYVSEADVGTRVFVNGQERFNGDTPTPEGTNANYVIGATLNVDGDPITQAEAYIAEFHYIQGQALGPAMFGATNEQGVWIPMTATPGPYGANGFYLRFEPGDYTVDGGVTTLADRSGNNNDFTCEGFNLDDNTEHTFDIFTDTPLVNFPIWNRNVASTELIVNAGCWTSVANEIRTVPATFGIPLNSGRFYYELELPTLSEPAVGWVDWQRQLELDPDNDSGIGTFESSWSWSCERGVDGEYFNQNSAGMSNLQFSQQVVGCFYDSDNGDFHFSVEGTMTENGDAIAFQADPTGYVSPGCGTIQPLASQAGGRIMNCGQQPWKEDPADAWNGGGAAWQRINTANFPDADIPDGRAHFRVVLGAGAGILGDAVGDDGFADGLWWIKSRANDANTNNHQLVNRLRIDDANANVCNPVPDNPNVEQAYVAPAENSVAWCWNAPTGPLDRNNVNFNITTTVQVNDDSGFAIVQFPGNGTNNQTMLLGITRPVDFIICFKLTDNQGGGANDPDFMGPAVYHRSMGHEQFMMLHASEGANAGGPITQNPGATQGGVGEATLTISGANGNGTLNGWNLDGDDYLMYCWSHRDGYSSFGSWEGNEDVDGQFIQCNFRPAWLLIKSVDDAGSWVILDTTRDQTNPANRGLITNQGIGEDVEPQWNVDILSNGFKVRTTGVDINHEGQMIYAAFAEMPTGANNVVPANAR